MSAEQSASVQVAQASDPSASSELDALRWPVLVECARRAVGSYPLHAVQCALRLLMLEEALIRGHGNLTATAKILGISRPAVQQMTQQFSLRATATSLRCPTGDELAWPQGTPPQSVVAAE